MEKNLFKVDFIIDISAENFILARYIELNQSLYELDRKIDQIYFGLRNKNDFEQKFKQASVKIDKGQHKLWGIYFELFPRTYDQIKRLNCTDQEFFDYIASDVLASSGMMERYTCLVEDLHIVKPELIPVAYHALLSMLKVEGRRNFTSYIREDDNGEKAFNEGMIIKDRLDNIFYRKHGYNMI